MDKDLRLTFRRGDLLAVLLVAAVALGTILAFMAPSADSGRIAQIYQEGRLLHELPLGVDTSIHVGGNYTNTVVISNGSVSIAESNCPGGDCKHSGSISAPGRSIVCLPNRVEVRISGSSDVDFVVR